MSRFDHVDPEAQRQRAREKAVYLYTRALERGDFDTVASILAQAERDPALEQMVTEVNTVLIAEDLQSEEPTDAALIEHLLREHLPSAYPREVDTVEVALLTVAAVAARMREDAAQQGGWTVEAQALIGALSHSEDLVPEHLSLNAIRQLFSALGLVASAPLIKQFRETAIFLAEGRASGAAFRAAARHQRRPAMPSAAPRSSSASMRPPTPPQTAQHAQEDPS